MKLHKNVKIELAASKDAGRPAIGEPYLDIKDGTANLIATNDKILAVVPVELDAGDTPGFISGECLKAGRKLTRETVQITTNGVCTFSNGATLPREGVAKDSQFPNWRAVVPAKDANDGGIVVVLDAALLWQLAQAMGTTGVLLKIKDDTAPILIFPHVAGFSSDPIRYACEDARGVMMPVKQRAQP